MRRNFVKVEWDEASQRVVCYLPLTSPTGKVRVKRNGKPLATRQEILTENDEIEWQIAYRDQTGQLVELGQILWLGRKHRVIGDEALVEMITELETQEGFFDGRFAVEVEPTLDEFRGFQLQWRKHPVLRRELEGKVKVTIELRHRQRAIGFQAMVFLLILLVQCQPADIIGRKAEPKELVIWSPRFEVTKSLVKAFGIASRSHREDTLNCL